MHIDNFNIDMRLVVTVNNISENVICADAENHMAKRSVENSKVKNALKTTAVLYLNYIRFNVGLK